MLRPPFARRRAWTEVANVTFEYKIVKGAPDDHLCEQLCVLSSRGWQVASATYGEGTLICLLKREKDFEVARSVREALEESPIVEAVARPDMPPEEIV